MTAGTCHSINVFLKQDLIKADLIGSKTKLIFQLLISK